MKNVSHLVLTSTLWMAAGTCFAGLPDRYSSYEELAKHEKEGVDFVVDTRSLHSSVSVVAIHGGRIESGSDQIAKEIAADDWSYYLFRAQKPGDNWPLHVTATHFNDPRAIHLAEESKWVVSIHGFREDEKDIVCVGGGNVELARKVAEALKKATFRTLSKDLLVESPCTRFGGSSSKNIVNRSPMKGVQLELSGHFRDQIVVNPTLLKEFSKGIRDSVLDFTRQSSAPARQ